MGKKRLILLSTMLAVFIATGITALAANCPACEASHVEAVCKTYGEHLWHNTASHTVDYSEGGVLKHETCTIRYSEDKVTWVCPNGHGTVMTQYHYKEIHSSSRCNSLDYYH